MLFSAAISASDAYSYEYMRNQHSDAKNREVIVAVHRIGFDTRVSDPKEPVIYFNKIADDPEGPDSMRIRIPRQALEELTQIARKTARHLYLTQEGQEKYAEAAKRRIYHGTRPETEALTFGVGHSHADFVEPIELCRDMTPDND